MSQEYKGCYVAFEKDMRDEIAEQFVEAIRWMRGVGAVTLEDSNSSDWMNRQQIRNELIGKIYGVLS